MKVYLFILSLIGSLIIKVAPSYAVFNLSVVPSEGGYELKFGKVESTVEAVSKEVRVSIISDLTKQYQLIQTLLQPLSNERGVTIPLNNFSVYAVRGSNRYGTMAVETERPVSVNRMLIYTSNSQGLSDDFRLIYVLKGPFNLPSGIYRGRLVFILEPLDSSQTPVIIVMNISAEIKTEATGIEIKTPTGSKLIALNSSSLKGISSDVLFEIKGEWGGDLRLYHLLSQPLESAEGRILPMEAINFQIIQAKKGSGSLQPMPVSLQPALIYNSYKGEADSFVLTYTLNKPEELNAGRYTTKLIYLLEYQGQQRIVETFNLEVEIAPIFNLEVRPQLGGIIEFRDLKPGSTPKSSEVIVEVKSNLGKRYQVSQRINSELIDKEGNKIPMKYFNLRQESLETKGSLRFPESTEVRLGETVLFVSDLKGSSDRFKIIYELEVPFDIRAGDYSTRIVYSISEI
ncbi:MAG: hypothetical protein NC909_01015 [Candidatus Omnitrophica bacterium]|nr:hypothetical protein [Candidatus Omnitrophota bacterium]